MRHSTIVFCVVMLLFAKLGFCQGVSSEISEIETIAALEKSFEAERAKYLAAESFKYISIIALSTGIITGTTSLTMRSLGFGEEATINNLNIASATMLSGSLIVTIVTHILSERYYKQMLYKQEELNDYLETNSMYERAIK